ncbi:hypothetical protein G8C93_00710 [Cellulosimicrobium cellulans]|nr:hypothetical protein [Cellulosimicrobium cellulans]
MTGALAHLGRAEDAISKAWTLLDAAKRCLDARDANDHAQQLLSEAMENAEEAQRKLEEAIEEEVAAADLVAEVAEDILNRPTSDVLDDASGHHREAGRSLGKVTKRSTRKRDLERDLAQLHEEIETLRKRL